MNANKVGTFNSDGGMVSELTPAGDVGSKDAAPSPNNNNNHINHNNNNHNSSNNNLYKEKMITASALKKCESRVSVFSAFTENSDETTSSAGQTFLQWADTKMNTRENMNFMKVILVSSTLANIVVFCVVVALTVKMNKSLQSNYKNDVILTDMACKTIYYDEVFTMSLEMASFTGDNKWVKRYDKTVGKFNKAYDEMTDIMPHSPELKLLYSTIKVLSGFEDQVLDLLAEGNYTRAQDILSSEGYTAGKTVFATALKLLNEAVTKSVQSSRQRVQHTSISVVTILAVFFPFMIAFAGLLIVAQLRFMKSVHRMGKRLHKEQQKTNALLHDMVPPHIAKKLQRGEFIQPEVYDSVTVLFCDIVGFTGIASRCTTLQVVDLLNDVYKKFDLLTERHGVYKLETVGDAYVAVAGLRSEGSNSRSTEHWRRVADLAVDMIKAANDTLTPEGQPVKIRIGIHTGPVAAGVIGIKCPKYCLFGDTMNMGSRLESTSVENKIQMSTEIMSLLQRSPEYVIEDRGMTPIKGKGDVHTYFLMGKVVSQLEHSVSQRVVTISEKPNDVFYSEHEDV